jgi:hypothetical protein
MSERSCRLFEEHGGCWLGPLWQWTPNHLRWHRGLLALRVRPRFNAEVVNAQIPWIDTLAFDIAGKASLREVVALLAGATVNHVWLELRQPFRETALQEALAALPRSSCLRTLGFSWPLGMLKQGEQGWNVPEVGREFLRWLLARSATGKHLTHLASTFAFEGSEVELIREHGVEPIETAQPFWAHALHPCCFHRAASPAMAE